MQISLETTSALGRRLKVAVPADAVEKEFNSRLQRLMKQVKLPGFRPGKVPLRIVEAQYGGRLMDEVAGELIQSTLHEAIGSQGLRPAGDPRVQRKPFLRGEQLEYTVEFEVYPEVKRFDLAGVRIERPVVTINQEDVERTIATIRKQRATWSPVENAARLGDRVKIDFVGRLDGQEFEGGKADGLSLVLGSGTLIESLEQGLVGAKAGDTRQLAAKFPADYRHVFLAGKTADFDVKIVEVAEAVLPEIDEAFARELEVKDASIETLRRDVKSNLEREAVNRARTVVRTRALQSLLEVNPLDLPQSLLQAEIGRLKNTDKSAGSTVVDEAAYERRARIRVSLGVILNEIIRARGLMPDPARLRARIEEMATDYDSPQDFIKWHYEKPERLNEVEGLIMEERVVEDLLVSAEVTEKLMSFQELLKLEVVLQ